MASPPQPGSRLLLPMPDANGGSGTSSEQSELSDRPRKRRLTPIACETCRKRKTKCGGERPKCRRCAEKKTECIYETDNAKAVATRRQVSALRLENEQLRELFTLLRDLPRRDALDALDHIRNSDDHLGALRFIRQASLLVPNPSLTPDFAAGDPRLRKLEQAALADSLIKVRCRPWTTVAGEGIVSELVSSFFSWDDSFCYPFIDREAFLEDMNTDGEPKNCKWCSPFLVNAVCALRCFTSRRAKSFAIITGEDLGELFVAEAKKLLDQEQHEPSLPVAQGLALMFILAGYRGMDRAGMMYRYAACEMLKSLKLDQAYDSLGDGPQDRREKRIISKALWGFFCFESIIAYVYLQLSLVAPPAVPRIFELETTLQGSNFDILGCVHTEKSRSPPLVHGVLYAICDLSLFLFQVMTWNRHGSDGVGSPRDLEKRRMMYRNVESWGRGLPQRLRDEVNFTPQTCFLRIYMDEVFLSMLRPLDPELVFIEGRAVKEICLQIGLVDVDVMERYVKEFSLRDYSCMVLCGLYNALFTVLAFIADPSTHHTFAKACMLMRQTAFDFPMSRFILQAVRAFTWTMKVPIPPVAMPYLEDLGTTKEELVDVPVSFPLPETDAVREFLSAENGPAREFSVDVGHLLSKWSAMTI